MRTETILLLAILLLSGLALGTVSAQEATPTATPNGTATGPPTTTPTATPAGNATAANASTNTTDRGTLLDARDARLVVRQPHYITEDVTQSRTNGTLRYTARGEELVLKPTAFDPTAVVDFGVAPAGRLTFDAELGVFRLHAPAPGTYTVFFVVQERQLQGETTQQVTARYAARIRVTGGTNLSHRPEGAFAEMQSAAENWTTLVETFEETGILDEGETMEGQLEEIIPWAQLRPTEDPLKALTGSYTQLLILLFLGGVGGYILLAQLLGLPVYALFKERAARLRFDRTEAAEGTAKDTLAELDYRERRQAPQTTRVSELYDDEQIAAAMQDAFGRTLGDAGEAFLNEHRPRLHFARNLNLLGANGWVGVAEDAADLRADGGDPDDSPVALVEETDLPADVDPETADHVHDLTDVAPDDDLLERIDPQAPLEVPIEDLDALPDDLAETPDFELKELARTYEADMRLFEDPATYGDYLERHVAFLHDHAVFSDGEAGVDPEQYVLGRYLKLAQYMQDQFDWPAMGYIRRAIRLARVRHDTAEETADLIEQIQTRGREENGENGGETS